MGFDLGTKSLKVSIAFTLPQKFFQPKGINFRHRCNDCPDTKRISRKPLTVNLVVRGNIPNLPHKVTQIVVNQSVLGLA